MSVSKVFDLFRSNYKTKPVVNLSFYSIRTTLAAGLLLVYILF